MDELRPGKLLLKDFFQPWFTDLYYFMKQFQHWFFIENSTGESSTDWICTVFDSTKADQDFKEKLLTR
jgi:hypothetical protein